MAGKKISIGKWELTATLINAMTTQIYLGVPRVFADLGGTAAWIIPVYIGLVALIIFLIIARLFSRYEGKDLLEVAEQRLGNVGRVITGILFVTYIIIVISLILREFAEDMKIIAFTMTPISYVMFFFLAGMIFAAFFGIEAILRVHAIAVPIIIIGFIVIFIGVAPYYDFTNLLPVLGNGPFKLIGTGFFKITAFSSLTGLFMFFPYVKTNKNFKSIGIISITASSAMMLFAILSYTLVYPYPISSSNLLPVFQLARLINYGRFFQRIESLFVLIWAASALLYLSFGFFVALHVFKRTFKLSYYRPMILPFAVVVFCVSILPQSLMTTSELDNDIVKNFSLAISLGLTLIILLIGQIGKKNEKKAGAKK